MPLQVTLEVDAITSLLSGRYEVEDVNVGPRPVLPEALRDILHMGVGRDHAVERRVAIQSMPAARDRLGGREDGVDVVATPHDGRARLPRCCIHALLLLPLPVT